MVHIRTRYITSTNKTPKHELERMKKDLDATGISSDDKAKMEKDDRDILKDF